MKASEDQMKLEEFLASVKKDRSCGDNFYYHFEPFDPKLLAGCYGIKLDTGLICQFADESTYSK